MGWYRCSQRTVANPTGTATGTLTSIGINGEKYDIQSGSGADKADITAIGTNETGTTASRAYAVGEHFYKDGKFCTAIASIAQDATFTLGTNYVEGMIADAINNTIIPITLGSDFKLATDRFAEIIHIVGDMYAFCGQISVKNSLSSGQKVLLTFDNTSIRFRTCSYQSITNKGNRINITNGGNNNEITIWAYSNMETDEWFGISIILHRTA